MLALKTPQWLTGPVVLRLLKTLGIGTQDVLSIHGLLPSPEEALDAKVKTLTLLP